MSGSLVVHDYFQQAEGGGRLCLTLARALGADLAYGFKVGGHPFFNPPFPGKEHDLGLFTNLQGVKQFRLARGFARKANFIRAYDSVVYSGFYAPLAVGFSRGKNIYYCHTPPRFLYDQREFYQSLAAPWQRPLLAALSAYLKPRYEAAVAKMDVIVANSDHVRKRIARHLGHESVVVHPPCDLAGFHWDEPKGYYLSMARLDPLKRVDRVVEAFKSLPRKRLIVASGGAELGRIRESAAGAPNIEITGWVGEERLRRLLAGAVATIYVPRDEDFGMSPVESMAAGKPVIAAAEGGIPETVVHGETGLLLRPDPAPEEIARAVDDLTVERAVAMRRACIERAERFNISRFIDSMRSIVGIP